MTTLQSLIIVCLVIAANISAEEPAAIFDVNRLITDTEAPPEAKPYELPTFIELTEHYSDHIPALISANMPDSDQVFQTVVDCHPR
jgi:hypothetical protein